MKESKLIRLKNEVRLLTKTVKQLIEDFLKLDSITRGTLTAFQLHIGEEEWKNRQTRFVRPVYTDQVIRLKFTISDKRDIDEEYGLISVDFEATFEGGELVLTSKKNLYRIKKEPPTNR